MTDLEIKTKELNAHILAGDTIAAIELFYDKNVVVQENEDVPRIGKSHCLENEEQNLKGIKELTCKLLSQAVNNDTNTVFSEWEIIIDRVVGGKAILREVSIQHWVNGQIISEKFYYKEFVKIS